MFRKRCSCEYNLYIQKIRHDSEMENILEAFIRLRRDMAYLQFELTGRNDALEKLEYDIKNGGF